MMTCSGPSSQRVGLLAGARVLLERAGQHAREVLPDGRLLGDDEGLGHGRRSVAPAAGRRADRASARARAGVDRPGGARRATRAHDRVGHAVAAGGPPPLRRGEDRRQHAPARVDERAAGVAGPHVAAERRDRCAGPARGRRRPASGRSRVAPTRAGAHVERPVLAGSRGSPPACPTATSRGERAARGAPRPGDAQHRDVVARVERDRASRRGRSPSPRELRRSCRPRRRRRARS